MYFLPFRFFGRRVCTFRRSHAAPSDWTFLRNYKGLHRERIDEAIHEAGLEAHILVSPKAYDETGRPLPEKIAVYADSQEVAGLFFQFYAQVKAQHQRETARVFGSNRGHPAH